MIALPINSIIVLVLGATAAAAAPVAEEVTRLVSALDARELAQRERAERELVQLGPAALPYLPPTNERTPAETAERIARVQQKLLVEQARSVAAATYVTLKAVEIPLAEAFEAISKQTGNTITDHRQAFGEQKSEPRISVDFDKTEFWPAIDQVLDQAGLTLYPFTGRRGAFVVGRPADAVPRSRQASYAGVFRLAPVRFEAVRDLRSGREQSLKFFLEIDWEPRLQPIALVQSYGRVSASGNDGTPIAVANAQTQGESLVREGISAAELEIPLQLPPRNVARIATLKGQLLAMVPGPRHDFRFASLPLAPSNATPRRVELRQAGTTVTVDSLRKNNDVWEVSVRVKFDDPGNSLESHRGWILENQAFFETADGTHIDPAGLEQTRQAPDEVGVKYFFELKHDPSKLAFVYRTPITILQMEVNYEFHDLDLP